MHPYLALAGSLLLKAGFLRLLQTGTKLHCTLKESLGWAPSPFQQSVPRTNLDKVDPLRDTYLVPVNWCHCVAEDGTEEGR